MVQQQGGESLPCFLDAFPPYPWPGGLHGLLGSFSLEGGPAAALGAYTTMPDIADHDQRTEAQRHGD